MKRKLPCIKLKSEKIFFEKIFSFKKKYILNIPISIKFFFKMHQGTKNPKSFCNFFPSTKFSQKNPLKKIFNFLGWIYFGNFFWENFELGMNIYNDFGFIATWWISKKNFIEIGMLNIYFFLKRKYFLEKKIFHFWILSKAIFFSKKIYI